MVEPSPTFCILPWIHVFADEAGVMWPCCRAVGSRKPNLDDTDGRPRRVHAAAGVAAGLDTAVMRRLRRDLLDGRRPAECERCYMVEDLGIESHRQSENRRRRADIAAVVAATGPDGALAADIRTADIRLGNACNLRCRMCSPQSSRALIPEWAAQFGLAPDHRHFDAYRGRDWFEEADFWAMLERDAPRLERINFAGGEPLLIAAMVDYLDRMAATGRAAGMTVSYNTNLTMLPPRALALWPAFKAVRVTVSLDGFGAVNDFVRHPSRWETIAANLRRLDGAAESLNLGGGLAVNTAVQVYNVFRLGELLDFLAGLERVELPNLSIVTQPDYLSLRILPPELKALAADRLRAAVADGEAVWRRRWGDDTDRLVAAIDGVVEYMDGDDLSRLLPQFLRWARHQDGFRGQSTPAAIPELAPLFAGDAAVRRGRPAGGTAATLTAEDHCTGGN